MAASPKTSTPFEKIMSKKARLSTPVTLEVDVRNKKAINEAWPEDMRVRELFAQSGPAQNLDKYLELLGSTARHDAGLLVTDEKKLWIT